MCGFAGYVSRAGLSPRDTLQPMTQAIEHRGPDDYGYYTWNGNGQGAFTRELSAAPARVGLGFRRLSILDLTENAAQPMASPDGRFRLCFNGQIYNFEDLKESFFDETWRSTGDTEVLLRLLERDGIAALPKLNGMYAFSFFDSLTGEMILARDPLGIKPLYYRQTKDGVVFGSEIRAIAAAGLGPLSFRREMVVRYLSNSWIPEPDTMFEGVYKLPPGHYLRVNRDGVVSEHVHWNWQSRPDRSLSRRDWEEKLEQVLYRALDRQMRSDVPLGFFLSGGVDSSLLTVRAAMTQASRPTAYSVGFQWGREASIDEDLAASRLVAKQFPMDRHEILLAPSLADLLPRVVDVLEEPISDAAALCSYLICDAAKSKLKVLISGQGADEIFGGYPVYQSGRAAAYLSYFSSAGRLMAAASHALPYSVFGKAIRPSYRAKKILLAAGSPWPLPYLRLRSPFQSSQLEELLLPEVARTQESPFGRHLEYFETAKHWDAFSQMMYLDTKTFLPALNLAYSDKTSMAHSVELRVPYLDTEVVELAQTMPSQYKTTLRSLKILLKAVAAKTLPHDVVYRRKAGFEPPLRNWFLKDLKPMAEDLLAPDRLRRLGLFNPELPQKWMKEHCALKADHSLKLYSLMTLELWADRHGFSRG